MKVALICPYDLSRPGGVQNQVLELARQLRAGGDIPVVIGPGASEGVDLGETITVSANRSRVPVSIDPRVGKAIAAAVADVDVIHLHEPLVPTVGWAALGAERPMVATFHAAKPGWVNWLYRVVPARWWQRRVLTAVSPVAAQLPWPRVRIVPNGIHLASFRTGGQRHRQRVVFVGRDDHRKGLDVLLAAWRKVQPAALAAELMVIGPSRADDAGVRYVGQGDDVAKASWLQTSAILVAPNLGGESFGLVVAEGMAAGCAVVASDLPAFRYVTGGTARLTPPGEPGPLAAALFELLTNPAQTDAMGKRARERAAQFDWANVFPQYRAAYSEAISLFDRAGGARR